MLKFPSNLPLSAEQDNDDDSLRLFYVALSRAKENLFVTYSTESPKIRFLEQCDNQKNENPIKDIPRELIEMQLQLPNHTITNIDEKSLLQQLTQDYKLSVTHLNNFLDVVDGGPQKFLEQNLLRFPPLCISIMSGWNCPKTAE